jgi:hypothetical protein
MTLRCRLGFHRWTPYAYALDIQFCERCHCHRRRVRVQKWGRA